MSQTAMERLETLLNERDSEIEVLHERVRKAEEAVESDATWTRHRIYEDPSKAPHPSLPIPRLQIEWREKEQDSYTIEAVYSLVYRHLLGHIVYVPFGLTKSSGALAGRLRDGMVDLPFRDGAHFRNEMMQLNLRGFGIIGDLVHEYMTCPACGRLDYCHVGPDRRFGPDCTMPRIG